MVCDDTTIVLVAVAVCNVIHVLFYSILWKVCVTGFDTVTKASNGILLSCSLVATTVPQQYSSSSSSSSASSFCHCFDDHHDPMLERMYWKY